MDSKDIIMQRLKKAKVEKTSRPEINFKPTTYEGNPVERMTLALKNAATNVVVKEEGEDINDIIKRQYPDAKRIVSNLPEITVATENPDNLEDPRLLDKTDLAVIKGKFGIIENGMIWIPQETRYKALFFIAESLLIILDKTQIVNNMHEAYKRKELEDFDYGVFIAGPSKTADIEQALVIGAHGAREVTVVLV